MMRVLTVFLALAMTSGPVAGQGAREPLRIEITEGVIEPLPFAAPTFVPETSGAEEMATLITQVVAADLAGTGIFREIPHSAFISTITNFASPIQYSDWKAINAQALITGAVAVSGNRVTVKFRLFDVFAGSPLGDGLQFAATSTSWRRMAHKVADAVYARITGEAAYFDSRIAFVSERGPKNARSKRLAIMDYDGANARFLSDSSTIVLAPRFSPDGDSVLYTGYETGMPQIYLLNAVTGRSRRLANLPGSMTFAPRFSPDGRAIVFSLSRGGNTDIYRMSTSGGAPLRLTSTPSIETAASFSPDGRRIVFESDRSGTQQLYVMSAGGGEATRISFGPGRYGTPVWSPRGDLIAFTKQNRGRFHIGVMGTDGSDERLLTASFLDEGPTWAPNGRVIMFTREGRGPNGAPSLYSVDVSGRNLRRVATEGAASDPSWSPLRP